MLVCRDDKDGVGPSAPGGGNVEEWVVAMDRRGVRITGEVLAPETEAAVVRVRDDRLQVTHGAFLETKGALLGFDLLECQDISEAIQVASDHPLAKRGVLEIRPVDSDEEPPGSADGPHE